MILSLHIIAIAILGLSALAAAAANVRGRRALDVASAGCVAACLLGFGAALAALLHGPDDSWRGLARLPMGEISLGIDALSSVFLLLVFAVAGLAAAFGRSYLASYEESYPLAPAAALFNLLVASMAALLLARDGVFFLLAWEAMSLASYFLVAFEDLEPQVRRAGLLYLVASHFGAACLLVLFLLMAGGAGAFHFSDLAAAQRAPGVASACFVLALAGFGLKAGLWPLHFWLPEAHPAAPSHVSALMSGAMIEMGIYGLLRVLPMVSVPPTWWGLALAAVGGVTALFGVLGAVTQRDLKRVLAYSSVENMGIVAMAAGAGFLGRAAHHPQMAILGFGAALTHLLNHGLFKGLLFQCAGAIFHGTGTRDLERLGGLRTAMPMTGALFLTGAIAACGLPPLNGFPGEWLLFRSAFAGLGGHSASGALVGALGMAALALVGGLAAAAFARAHGVVFLGLPRSPDSPRAHETPLGELMPMALGAALCLALGLFPGIVLGLVAPAAAALSGAPPSSARLLLSANGVPSALLVLVALAAGLALLRSWLLSGRDVRSGPVWGCGYEQPDARMQYTAASFPEPAATSFGTLLRSSEAGERPAGYFPASSSSEERLDDLAADGFLAPALAKFAEAMRGVRRFQPGRVQIYLVYVFATVLVLLVWQVGGAW